MSHFTVLVIGNDPEEQLAQFQENNMGDCPQEYLKYRVWDDEGNDHWFENEQEFLNAKIDCDDSGYFENPNAKWDWYQLGGRWNGFFKIKDGLETLTEIGQGSLIMRPRNTTGRADSCLKKYIDIDGMRNDSVDKAANIYDKAMLIIGNLPINRTWSDIGKEFNYSDQERKIYGDQERVKAWEQADRDTFGFFSSCDDFAISRDKYLENAFNSAIATHAVIVDGKWYERGEMGWFAVVSNEKINWDAEFNKLLDSVSDDTLLSIYDCHI